MRVGVDLLSIERFNRISDHPRAARIVFTDGELEYAGTLGLQRRREFLAGRFCAKEATAKLLGRGYGQGLRWRDIEVTRDEWGAPSIRLSGGADRIARRAGLRHIEISISHHVELVICAAVGIDDDRKAQP